ncbi:hypothetical protein ACFL2R_00170 [Patescibacteria group bacterium]
MNNNESDKCEEQFVGYLKFFGPEVDDGRIDIEKVGNSLIALNRIYKNFSKQHDKKDLSLKLGGIKKNCTEINIHLEQIAAVVKPAVSTASWLMVAKSSGVMEFGKQFFGTIGQQLALKLFSKGGKIEKVKEFIEKDNVFVRVRNVNGEEKVFLKDDYDNQKEYSGALKNLVQLESEKEDKMEVGYYQNCNAKKVAEVNHDQKKYFSAIKKDLNIEDRLNESFDDSETEQIKIVGKFVDYHGLAHKYNFSFQARKNQEDIGKQKILCIIEGDKISDIAIDFLKPKNQKKNICIFGEANRNSEGKIDKIKVEWVNEDENFNHKQRKLVW